MLPSLRQMVGQRLMVGFSGTDVNDDLRFLIQKLKVGGIILFKRNLEHPDQIRRLCDGAQACATESGLPPLFIAVDQEGGCVSRLPTPYSQFDGNPSMGSEADASRFADITGKELAEAGFNMNMAPVLDVAHADCSSVMAERAFGADPLWVARLGNIVIEGLQRRRIMAVAKHFPGIGRTVLDSHLELPSLAVDLEDLMAEDLPPFQKAIEHHVDGLMLSHIIYEKIDPHWPASLSKRITADLLRTHFRFDGVVMTDDLDMGAIAKHFDIRTVIRQVMTADIDIALICHSMEKMEIAHGQMTQSVAASESLKRANKLSFDRIMHLKQTYLIS